MNEPGGSRATACRRAVNDILKLNAKHITVQNISTIRYVGSTLRHLLDVCNEHVLPQCVRELIFCRHTTKRYNACSLATACARSTQKNHQEVPLDMPMSDWSQTPPEASEGAQYKANQIVPRGRN